MMHRMMYGGIGLLGLVWGVVMFGVKKYSQDFPPWLWRLGIGFLVLISLLYAMYCIFRIITSKRSKAEWFAESGVLGRFALHAEKGAYFSKKYTDVHDGFVVRFFWIGKTGDTYSAELPAEKMFFEVRDLYEGPPVVEYVFRDSDSREPFVHIRPRLKAPSWWLSQKNAEKLGFVCAQIVIGKEDFLSESLCVPFPHDHIHYRQ